MSIVARCSAAQGGRLFRSHLRDAGEIAECRPVVAMFGDYQFRAAVFRSVRYSYRGVFSTGTVPLWSHWGSEGFQHIAKPGEQLLGNCTPEFSKERQGNSLQGCR